LFILLAALAEIYPLLLAPFGLYGFGPAAWRLRVTGLPL